jgi:hypothetical protein
VKKSRHVARKFVFNRVAYAVQQSERFCRKCGREFGQVTSRIAHEKECKGDSK